MADFINFFATDSLVGKKERARVVRQRQKQRESVASVASLQATSAVSGACVEACNRETGGTPSTSAGDDEEPCECSEESMSRCSELTMQFMDDAVAENRMGRAEMVAVAHASIRASSSFSRFGIGVPIGDADVQAVRRSPIPSVSFRSMRSMRSHQAAVA